MNAEISPALVQALRRCGTSEILEKRGCEKFEVYIQASTRWENPIFHVI
jgi:hypothetical protein